MPLYLLDKIKKPFEYFVKNYRHLALAQTFGGGVPGRGIQAAGKQLAYSKKILVTKLTAGGATI